MPLRPSQSTSFFPFTVKVQKTSGASLYFVVPKQIVAARKIKHGGLVKLRLRDDGVMEAVFE